MELELRHLASYLPYGLDILWEYLQKGKVYNESFRLTCVEQGEDDLFLHSLTTKYEIAYSKAILRPLSQLNQEIEHNGEKFIPMDEIADVFANTPNWNNFKQYWGSGDLSETIIEHCVFRQLCEWHFDVFGLIDAGLAIPKK